MLRVLGTLLEGAPLEQGLEQLAPKVPSHPKQPGTGISPAATCNICGNTKHADHCQAVLFLSSQDEVF